MKMKSVLAAVVAAGALSALSVAAFAEEDDTLLIALDQGDEDTDLADDEGAEEVGAEEDGAEEDAAEADAAADGDAVDTGVEGVAAVVGVIAIAGAAVVISRKRA